MMYLLLRSVNLIINKIPKWYPSYDFKLLFGWLMCLKVFDIFYECENTEHIGS